MTTENLKKYGSMAALAAAGVVGGAVLAGTFTANAASPTPTPRASSDANRPANPNPGDPGRPQRADESLLTGDTAAKVKAAVLKKYPGATFTRVETDSDGVYEAHIVNKDGTPTTVELDKSFAVTGEEQGGPGGPGGRHGGPGPMGGPPPQDTAPSSAT
jgi:hypothetical protein